MISRLLRQATFGPSRSGIRDYISVHGTDPVAGPAAWVAAQQRLRPTLLRQHLRERSNPRQLRTSQVGVPRGPCESGSRWHRHAFTIRDQHEILTVWSEHPGVFSLRINGSLRSEVSTFNGTRAAVSAPAVRALKGTYKICETHEVFLGQYGSLTLSAAESTCDNADALFVEPNPNISFSPSSLVSDVLILGARDAHFDPVSTAPGGLLLGSLTNWTSCVSKITNRVINTPIFADWHGTIHKYDPRLRLLANEASPGEVANDPARGHLYPFMVELASNTPMGNLPRVDSMVVEEELDHPSLVRSGSNMLWTNVALCAPDQLRQRTAWALSQILVLSKFGLGRENEIEILASYYDIFVRHAFGNYRDILKEVTLHPAMGMYLTHMNNQALASSGSYPDENLAREVMQLFTIGLWHLNQDGTPALDERGELSPTYGNRDVMTYAAVWTGLTTRQPRSNIETGHAKEGRLRGTTVGSRNELDPMQIDPLKHDTLPKPLLGSRGYLADGFPLCADLPKRHFLAKGAKYRLIDEVSAEGETFDSDYYAQGSQLGRFRPQPGESELHAALCAQGTATRCTFPAEVQLAASLPCHGHECLSDHVRSVEVNDTVGGLARWYEYVRPACARLTFTHSRSLTSWKVGGTEVHHQCADRSAPAAAALCCNQSDGNTPLSTLDHDSCLYAGELVKHATAVSRCERRSAVLCHPDHKRPHSTTPESYWETGCGKGVYVWTDSSCNLKLQVQADGLVNLVDDQWVGFRGLKAAELSEHSFHTFRIYWEGDEWPRTSDGCGAGCIDTSKTPPKYDVADFEYRWNGELLTRAEHEAEARKWGGHLVSIISERELQHVMSVMEGPICFIGAYRHGSGNGPGQDHWHWSDGSTWRFTNWRQGEPNDFLEREDAAVMGKDDGKWADDGPWRRAGVYKKRAISSSPPAPPSPGSAGAMTCLCDVSVTDEAVFTDATHGVPTAATIEASLFIGAQSPERYDSGEGEPYRACRSRVCRVAARETGVVVHMKTGRPWKLVLDIDTIFQIPYRGETRYLMNRVSTGSVAGGAFTFRNPPHHMPLAGEWLGRGSSTKWLVGGASAAADDAMEEIDALLDALFWHNNTAPFLATRLIQRLGPTSNPSRRYTKTVASAFRSGEYGGVAFSRRYGDLAAAVAAIVLDREARSTTLDADSHFGGLREPLLMVLHVLRAMEYRSKAGREVNLYKMEDRIGMAAFESPSVFNFYQPEYSPSGPVGDAGLVSPEAQLLTAPHVVGLTNGLYSVIDYGLTSCHGGFGQSISRPPRVCSFGKRADAVARASIDGELTFSPGEPESPTAVVDELALLLTDGRLGERTRQVAVQAYDAVLHGKPPDRGARKDGEAPARAALRVAQKLLVIAPEFHSSGLDVERGPPRDVPAVATSGGRPFKAVVVLFMHGGLDSWNALVPHSCSPRDLYRDYRRRRTTVALNKSSLLAIRSDAADQPCSWFGLHPRLTALQRAYAAGDALAVANVGTLVEPTTKAQFGTPGSVQLPPQLFSHNVQRRCVQNVHAQSIQAKGVLGRAVTALDAHEQRYRSRLFSTSGSAKMLEGAPHAPDFLDKEKGIIQPELGGLGHLIRNITSPVSSSIFAETYKGALEQALRTTEELGAAMDAQRLSARFASDPISMQLAQVCKVLKLQPQLQLERAAFFTEHFGFDTHTDAIGTVDVKLAEVNAALASFEAELKAQGLWESVTVVTASDFGRTLTSNGQGTDHGWGGNIFVVGGAIKGGRVLGTYPSDLSEGNPLDIGRGRMLPTLPWEAVWSGVLEWFGIEASQMDTVLPNRQNFAASQLIGAAQMFEAGPR